MTGAEIAILTVFLFIIVAQLVVVGFLLFYKRDKATVAATKAQKTPKQYKNPSLVAAVKAVAVLVCICFVCVALLALCNDLLYVSDELRLARAMGKIYEDYGNGDTEWNNSYVLDSAAATNSYGTVTDVKRAEDGAYVITAKGGGGYKGTITIYIVVKEETVQGKNDVLVKAWTIKEHDGETFLGNITDRQRKEWYVGKSITEYTGDAFALNNNKVTGTSLSSTAINNAVKAACDFCVNVLKLVSTPESEARDAVNALLPDYTFTNVSDSDGFTAFTVGEQTLSFYFEGVNGDEQVEAYVYGTDDNRQIVVVKAGLTHAERLAQEVVAKSANATDDVVNKVKSLSYFEYLVGKFYEGFEFDGMAEVNSEFAANDTGTVNKVYTSTNGAIVIESTGKQGFATGTVTINVIIADGKIAGWWIVSYDESQTFMQSNIISKWDTVKKWFVGSSIQEDQKVVVPDQNPSQGLNTGATYSERSIINAINIACYYARSIAA